MGCRVTFPGQTVTRVARTVTRDPMGDETITETRTDIPGCAVAPRTATETTERSRRDVITGITVYMPYGTVLDPDDRLEVGAVEYEIEGEPGSWQSPFTGVGAGIEVAARRAVTG
jgi:hypothetical protein